LSDASWENTTNSLTVTTGRNWSTVTLIIPCFHLNQHTHWVRVPVLLPSSEIHPRQNLLCENDDSRRHKLLYRGNTDIISCLSTLQRTQHVGHSFVADLTVFTPQLIMMSESGLFWEQGPTGKHRVGNCTSW
jgi:hypothetical protein